MKERESDSLMNPKYTSPALDKFDNCTPHGVGRCLACGSKIFSLVTPSSSSSSIIIIIITIIIITIIILHHHPCSSMIIYHPSFIVTHHPSFVIIVIVIVITIIIIIIVIIIITVSMIIPAGCLSNPRFQRLQCLSLIPYHKSQWFCISLKVQFP